MNNNRFYRDMSTTMLAKRMKSDYGAQRKLNPSTGPEGFAEEWVKIHLRGNTLQEEIVAKFMQSLYEIGNAGKKKTK